MIQSRQIRELIERETFLKFPIHRRVNGTPNITVRERLGFDFRGRSKEAEIHAYYLLRVTSHEDEFGIKAS